MCEYIDGVIFCWKISRKLLNVSRKMQYNIVFIKNNYGLMV